MARFHPDAALLTAYAAGTLPEPVMLVVATHLAACPECCAEISAMLRVGGHCVEFSTPAAVSASCQERILKAISCEPQPAAGRTEHGGVSSATLWPRPLQTYVAQFGEKLPWKKRAFGMRVLNLPCTSKAYKCFLMDIKPDRQIPAHSHCGEEMVAILRGAVMDDTGRFEAGDFIFGDNSVVHEQASDPEAGCVCLVVLRGDVDFRGRFWPLLNTLGRIGK